MNKNILLKNNGDLYALNSSLDSDNTIAGAVAIDNSGGIFNAGGARADYAANSNWKMPISGPIRGSSSAVLTKKGPGAVTLTNSANTFSGMTNLIDGTLAVNGAFPGGVTLSASPTTGITTTLAGAGTLGGTVVNVSNTLIAPGPTSAANSVGTLTLHNLNTSGGTINFDLSSSPSSGNDLLNCNDYNSVHGDLSLSGSTTISINQINGPGTLTSGSYRLINYTGSKTGSAASNLTLVGTPTGSRKTYALDDSTAHQINLVVAGSAASLTWIGDGISNNWNVADTSNHVWTGAAPDAFYNLDNVTFNDTSSNQSVVLNQDAGRLREGKGEPALPVMR